jgi:RecB family exonuclease
MGAKVLRILPDADRVDAALREASRISAEAGVGVVDGTGFLSFADLLDALLEGSDRRICSPLESRSLVMALCAGRAGPFGEFARTPSFARAAVELFEELKLGNAGASELGAAAAVLPGRGERLVFLAELFLAYGRALRERGWADRVDRLALASERLEEQGLPAEWRGLQRIEIADLYDFPPARISLVLALWRAAERAGVALSWRIPAGLSQGVDAAVDGIFAAMERSAPELAGGELIKDEPGPDRPLAELGRVLFSEEGRQAPVEDLSCVSCASTRQEVVEIARCVRRWVDQGTPPERIAVAFRNLGEEAEALEETLAQMGLRARARRGVPLGATAVGSALLGLPGLLEDGFPAERVAAMLTCGNGGARLRELPDAPLAWFKRAGVRDASLGAVGEKDAYAVRLGALAERLAGKKSHAVEDVRKLAAAVENLIRRARAIPEVGSAAALVEGWREAVEALAGSPEAARYHPEELPSAVLRSLGAEQRAKEALIALGEALSQALEATGAGGRRLTRRELQSWLWDAASDLNVPAAGSRLGAVRILEVRELIGQRFDHVALGGVTEGRFPVEAGGGGLLSEDERFAVNRAAGRDVFRDRAGEVDGRIRWSLAEDRLVFAQALAAATGSVCVFTARVGDDGRPARPSPFFEELLRRTGAEVTQLPAQVSPRLSDVASERELRTTLALEAALKPELRLSESELGPGWSPPDEGWLVDARRLAKIELERLTFFGREDAPPGPFSGRLSGEALERARARLVFGPDAPLSASMLAKFGNCRFQGLYGQVLRLRSPDEAGEDLDSRTRGTFWHAVLREVFVGLEAKGLLGRPADELPDTLLDAAIEAAVAEVEASAPIGHPELWTLSQDRARAMVRRVLDAEHRGVPFGTGKLFTELSFGEEDAEGPFRSVKLPGTAEEGDVYLRGSIDRLDVSTTGGGVVDFKVRSLELSKLREALLVSDFQLPLYLHVVRQAGHGTLRRAGWMSLKTAELVELDKVLAKVEDTSLEDLLEVHPERRSEVASRGAKNLANAVHGLLGTMRGGDFGPRPHDCAFCELQAVCRIGAAKAGVAE